MCVCLKMRRIKLESVRLCAGVIHPFCRCKNSALVLETRKPRCLGQKRGVSPADVLIKSRPEGEDSTGFLKKIYCRNATAWFNFSLDTTKGKKLVVIVVKSTELKATFNLFWMILFYVVRQNTSQLFFVLFQKTLHIAVSQDGRARFQTQSGAAEVKDELWIDGKYKNVRSAAARRAS